MHKLSIYSSLLLEIRRETVIYELGEEEGNKLLTFTRDNAYYHLVVNTVRNGEKISLEKLFDYKLYNKFRDSGISSAWNSDKTVSASLAGSLVILDKNKSGYSDFVNYLTIKETLKTSTSSLIEIIEINYRNSNDDFNVLINDSEWYIAYPKTQKGSIALGRSYWNREENKLKYDETFEKGEGDHIGIMRWCTSISGANNKFTAYHINKKLHMFYCISKRFGVEDNKRKICLSLEKESGNVYFCSNPLACVDANNNAQDEEFFRRNLGERYNKLIKYTEDKLEEIDYITYYKKYDLIQYKSQYENMNIDFNIEESMEDISHILNYTEDINIFYEMYNSNIFNLEKLILLANCVKTPIDILRQLCTKEDDEIKSCIASNISTPQDCLVWLSNNSNTTTKLYIVQNPNTPVYIITGLIRKSDDIFKQYLARNARSSLILNFLTKNSNNNIKELIKKNPNTPSYILSLLNN